MTRRQAAAAGAAALAAAALLLAWLLGGGGEGEGRRRPREKGTPVAPAPREEGALAAPAGGEGAREPEEDPPSAPTRPPAPEVPEPIHLLEGVVLDGRDLPVPGAAVSWGTLPPAEEDASPPPRDVFLLPRPAPFAAESTAVSGEDGTFRLAGPSRNRVVVTAHLPGGRVEPFGPFLFEGSRRGIVLRVLPAPAVTGQVLRPPAPRSWPEGEEEPPPKPEPGARVAAWWRGPLHEPPWPPRFEDAVTDAEGRFRIEGVPPGECTVEARAADGKVAEVRRAEGATGDLLLLLRSPWRRTSPFEGVILLSDGATPAAGARLSVTSAAMEPGEPPVTVTCAKDGTFRVEEVPSRGPSIECPLGVTVDAGARGVARVAVPAWPRTGRERIVLWPPAFRTVGGTALAVEDEGSPPVPGLPLRIRTWHRDPHDPRVRIPAEATVRTRVDGTFAAENLGIHGIDIAVPPGAAPLEVARFLDGGDGFRVEVIPACTLEGTVRTAEGEFVEGALCSWNGLDSVLTDREGRFRFHPVPGNRALTVLARAPGWAEGRSLPVTVPHGGAVRDLVILLEARAAVVSGRVVDGMGAPLPLAKVEVSADGTAPRGYDNLATTWTDGEGRWRLELRPGGRWRVTATAAGMREDHEDGVAGGAVRDLRLVSGEEGK